MILITRTPCLRRHTRLGTVMHAWNCQDCGGTGTVATRTEVKAVEIGPGWCGDTYRLSYEMRHDVAMLASALGSRTWPPGV